MVKLILFFNIFILCQQAQASSVFSQVSEDYSIIMNCSSSNVVEEEFYKLFRDIKKNILGEKPRFCETVKKNSLSSQIKYESNSFDKFMDLLEKAKTDKKDLNNSIKTGEDLKNAFFEVSKILVIKNSWLSLTENDKNELYFNDECEDIGINKFPLMNLDNQDKKESQKLKRKIENACRAKSISDLAPMLNKDTVAEVFLVLKNLYPQTYPKFVEYFCNTITLSDDILSLAFTSFENDQYDKIFKNTDEFNQWFRFLADENSEVAKRAKELDATKKIKKAEKQIEELNTMYQEQYSQIYQSAKSPEEATYGENKEYIIKKLPNGKFIAKNNNKKILPIPNYVKERLDEYLNELKKGYVAELNTGAIAKIKNQFVTSNNPKFIKDVLKTAKFSKDSYDKILEKIKDVNASPAGQIRLKDMYENYLKGELKDDVIYPGNKNPVMKNKDGSYSQIDFDQSFNTAQNKYMFENLSKVISPLKIDNFEIVPYEENSFYAKTKDGKYLFFSLGAENESLYFPDDDEKFTLRNSINLMYQTNIEASKKMTSLSSDQVVSLRAYTGVGFAQYNKCLRLNNCNPDQNKTINDIKDVIKILNFNEEKILYRGVKTLPPGHVKLLNSDEPFVLDNAFMSTSGSLRTAKIFAGRTVDEDDMPTKEGYIFLIKSKSCVGVNALSDFEEDEFLCPPGLIFKSKKMKGLNSYLIEEM